LKLATLKSADRDGALVVVDKALRRCVSAAAIAPGLRAAIETWSQTAPHLADLAAELEAGKRYAWCRCGRSQKQPFCDGAHAGTGIEPLMFTAERTEMALLCGCKDTGDPPYCDGSHMLL